MGGRGHAPRSWCYRVFLIRYAYLLDTRYCDWSLLLFSGWVCWLESVTESAAVRKLWCRSRYDTSVHVYIGYRTCANLCQWPAACILSSKLSCLQAGASPLLCNQVGVVSTWSQYNHDVYNERASWSTKFGKVIDTGTQLVTQNDMLQYVTNIVTFGHILQYSTEFHQSVLHIRLSIELVCLTWGATKP